MYISQIWNLFYILFLLWFRWKEIIRSDQKLSGDLKLLSWIPGRTQLSASEANAILSDWKKLQTLRISRALTDYDGDIPALIPEKYFLMVNFDAL